jgi:hypothetical protein
VKPCGKFVVIVDECDAAYRTEEGSQQFEMAFNQLMGMKPALRIEISATPVPTYLHLTARGYHVDFLLLGTSEDYAGVTDMKPLVDDNGGRIFLDMKQITHFEGVGAPSGRLAMTFHDPGLLFSKDDFPRRRAVEREATEFAQQQSLDFIPYTDDSVMRLYEDALSQPADNKKEGVLLLDCTASRVEVECNIFQKATGVQDHYFAQGKSMVVVVFVGNGIFLRRPGFVNGRYIPSSQKRIADVINRLDEEYGLTMPIFVFGWTKMRRCISYRSDKRVPTHMVLLLGYNQSDESYIQALGRATFNGLETTLAKNGHSHVTILTSSDDFVMAKKYQNFVQDMNQRIKAGENPRNLLRAAEKLFDGTNQNSRRDAAYDFVGPWHTTVSLVTEWHVVCPRTHQIRMCFPLARRRPFSHPSPHSFRMCLIDSLDSCNYKRHSGRKTGQVESLKNLLPDQSTFDVPDELGSDDEVFFDHADDNSNADNAEDTVENRSFCNVQILKRVMRAIYDLLHEGGVPSIEGRTPPVDDDDLANGRDIQSTMDTINRAGFSTRQIMEKYNDTFQDDCIQTIQLKVLNKALARLRNKKIVELTDTTKRYWRATNVRIFLMQCVKGGIDDDNTGGRDEVCQKNPAS